MNFKIAITNNCVYNCVMFSLINAEDDNDLSQAVKLHRGSVTKAIADTNML